MNFANLTRILFIAVILHLTTVHVELLSAQSLPINEFQEQQLSLQILLSDSVNIPLINRPYSYTIYKQHFSNSEQIHPNWWSTPIKNTEVVLFSDFRFGLQPVNLRNTYNTRLPNSENNQAAWFGRGSNTEFTGGMYITSKYFTAQISPQLVYQENKDFLLPRFIRRDSNNNPLYEPENLGAAMDAPFRFGPDPFTTFDLGYSSVRLHYNKFETGIGTEPLWWGPAKRYPLVMSNNAPGFPHYFISTREPVHIPFFGHIQFRWILGYPRQSEYYAGVGRDETRFTNAINATYTPVFFENLTLGIIRVFHLYEVDGFDFNNVTRILDPFSRSRLVSSQGEDEVRQDRNQTASFYIQIQLPEANAEVYAEYYREDHSYNSRDFIIQPHHNSAYTLGFQKISTVPRLDFILTNFEITSLTSSQLRQVRPQGMYYTHSRIRQGHTNRGHILGAAIGPGSNSQLLTVDAFKNNFKFGLFAQRLADNDNFHLREGSASNAPSAQFGDYFRHRIDLNFGLNFLYGPGPFYINSRLTWTKAYNYGRFDYGRFDGVTISNYERNDRTNVQFQIGITYIL